MRCDKRSSVRVGDFVKILHSTSLKVGAAYRVAGFNGSGPVIVNRRDGEGDERFLSQGITDGWCLNDDQWEPVELRVGGRIRMLRDWCKLRAGATYVVDKATPDDPMQPVRVITGGDDALHNWPTSDTFVPVLDAPAGDAAPPSFTFAVGARVRLKDGAKTLRQWSISSPAGTLGTVTGQQTDGKMAGHYYVRPDDKDFTWDVYPDQLEAAWRVGDDVRLKDGAITLEQYAVGRARPGDIATVVTLRADGNIERVRIHDDSWPYFVDPDMVESAPVAPPPATGASAGGGSSVGVGGGGSTFIEVMIPIGTGAPTDAHDEALRFLLERTRDRSSSAGARAKATELLAVLAPAPAPAPRRLTRGDWVRVVGPDIFRGREGVGLTVAIDADDETPDYPYHLAWLGWYPAASLVAA